MKLFLPLLLSAAVFTAGAAQTNSVVWHSSGQVDADVTRLSLWPLLEKITGQTGWRVYVEPGTDRVASTKFSGEPTDAALRKLLGDLNFALVPQTNAPAQLFIFRTMRQNATRLVLLAQTRHVPNELILHVKPGTDIAALAKLLGAKVTGRLDKLGLYRLQFPDVAAAEAALAQLQANSDVLAASYNDFLDAPPPVQTMEMANPPLAPVTLKLNPPPDSGKIIVGLIDTAVQPLDGSLNNFLLKQVSVADGTQANSAEPTHGTAMAETILRAISLAEQGSSSVQILPVDVYGSSPNATTWNVAAGIMEAVNRGANVLNLSLGGANEDAVLGSVIAAVEKDGFPIFAAAGNKPTAAPTYPAAYPGVWAVTALEQGKIAPYANFGNFVDLAVADGTVAYYDHKAWFTAGTSVSTANATGMAAGAADATHQSWSMISSRLSQLFPVPAH
ncbi:MAG TPA: S8 family serine peptidase [Desulfuromonadaceae bacterium]|nr:S8 family serine peptidase [Desulfuromonadaceae bacterium]